MKPIKTKMILGAGKLKETCLAGKLQQNDQDY